MWSWNTELSNFSSSLCQPLWILVSHKIFQPNNPPKLNLTQLEKHFTYERKEIISISLVKQENDRKTIFIWLAFKPVTWCDQTNQHKYAEALNQIYQHGTIYLLKAKKALEQCHVSLLVIPMNRFQESFYCQGKTKEIEWCLH